MFLKFNNILRLILVVVSGCYIAAYIILALIRIAYPFELEWMEGGVIDHCRRILDGNNLYVPPSVDFVPFIYTPLYFYISALMMKLVGVGFVAPRLISFLSSVGIMLLIYLTVKREAKSCLPALLSAALFAAAYRFTGAWYELARVDSLYLLLIIAAVFFAGRRNGIPGTAFIAVLLSLAFLTKQSGFVMAVCFACYYIFYDRRKFVVFSLIYTGLTGTVLLLLNVNSDGWFYYYTFLLPGNHALIKSSFVTFWPQYIFRGCSAALIVIAANLIFRKWKEDPPHSNFKYYLFILAGLIASSFIAGVHSGSYDNIAIPAIAGIAIMFGISFNSLFQLIPDVNHRWFTLLLIAALIQFSTFIYLPHRQIPSSKDRLSGERFITQLRNIDGPVFVRDHGFYSAMAGKHTFAHGMAVFDVLRLTDIEYNGYNQSEILRRDFIITLANQEFEAVILDDRGGYPGKNVIMDYYYCEGEIFESSEVFYPVTGAYYRPERLYLKKELNH